MTMHRLAVERRFALGFGLLLLLCLVALLSSGEADAQNPPGAIENLALGSDEPGTLTLSWPAPAPAPDDYRVRWARADLVYLSFSAANEEQRGNSYPSGDLTSLTLRDLTPGATYKVMIRARYEDGGENNGSWSGAWTQEAQWQVLSPPQPPEAASGLSAAADADGVDLSWTAPEHDLITGYRIMRGANATSLVTLVADTGTGDTAYRDDTVAAGSEYVYAVVVLSPAGESPPSVTAEGQRTRGDFRAAGHRSTD